MLMQLHRDGVGCTTLLPATQVVECRSWQQPPVIPSTTRNTKTVARLRLDHPRLLPPRCPLGSGRPRHRLRRRLRQQLATLQRRLLPAPPPPRHHHRVHPPVYIRHLHLPSARARHLHLPRHAARTPRPQSCPLGRLPARHRSPARARCWSFATTSKATSLPAGTSRSPSTSPTRCSSWPRSPSQPGSSLQSPNCRKGHPFRPRPASRFILAIVSTLLRSRHRLASRPRRHPLPLIQPRRRLRR